MKRIIGASVSLLVVAIAVLAITYQPQEATASDHDENDKDNSGRSINLSDHFAFKSPATPTELSLIMYFNPRGLPGRQYFMSTNARYEFHVTKIAARADAATGKDDVVFRFEAQAPNAAGVQQVKLTVLKDQGGVLTEVGSTMGSTTDFANSAKGTITTNTATNIGGIDVKWFIGERADSFHFDVVRFFQVRQFLAARFFGGAGGNGDATAELANNCRGDQFLAILDPACVANGACAKEGPGIADADRINLFNPPECAPDFTKNLNVEAIVLNVPIAQLGDGATTIFDTWSTISTLQ